MPLSEETKLLREAHSEGQVRQTPGQKGAARTGRFAKGGQTGGGGKQQTGGQVRMPPPVDDKRPPNMPEMMPRGSIARVQEVEVPDFGGGPAEREDDADEDYEKVEAQGDLDAAMNEGDEGGEEEAEEEDEQTEEVDAISPASTERANEKVLELLAPALGAALAVRGDEGRRMNETNRMREESVNRREG